MARNHSIIVSNGSVDPERLTVLRRDTVSWVPATEDVKIKIKFRNNSSPFKRVKFPDNSSAGEGVSAIVRKNANFLDYPYAQPGSRRRRRLRPLTDPVIIVKDNRRKKAKKRPARARKK